MTWSQAFNASYVKATYVWITEHYDGTKCLHKLALVYVIIFSKCILRVCNETKPHDILPFSDSTPIIHQCTWASPKDPNRKGMKEMIPFIITLYEETSPLQTYMNSHSKCHPSPSWVQPTCSCFADVKEIMLFNLVLMGHLVWFRNLLIT